MANQAHEAPEEKRVRAAIGDGVTQPINASISSHCNLSSYHPILRTSLYSSRSPLGSD